MQSSMKRGSCKKKYCDCVICRELTDCRMSANLEAPLRRAEGINFILRRALPFTGKSPSKEWLNVSNNDAADSGDGDYKDGGAIDEINHGKEMEDEATVPVTTGAKKPDKDVAHKTVIYFGDTNQKHGNRFNSDKGASSSNRCQFTMTKDESKMDERVVDDRDRDRDGDGDGDDEERCSGKSLVKNLAKNEDVKVTHEIVVNVSPSREDVLRIQEDESQVEDYWSLPGDNTGFKADWSFVQQWRLRG